MANLLKRGDKYSVRFTLNGKRKLLATGTTSERQAGRILVHVEAILKAIHAGCEVDQQTAMWLAAAPTKLKERMSNAGLIALADGSENAPSLKTFLDRYIDKRTDVKEITRVKWRQTIKCMFEFFGADRPITQVTVGDARDFERWMKQARKLRYADVEKSEALASATLRKRISHAKQFFADAVSRKLIETNPFDGLKSTVGANRSRDRFVTPEEATKVLAACPSNEWRLLFALSRFGGLRCPSEHLALRWADVDLVRRRMTVRSPKTEHHEGKESRLVPIFPELLPYLQQARDEAKPGAEFVITSYRDASTNLRTHLRRIIRRAGLEPWPKLWANLRSSRATELVTVHGPHVAATWLGHSTAVAAKHYWQVTESDFAKAVTSTMTAAQNVTTFVTTQRSMTSQTTTAAGGNTAFSRSISQAAVALVPPSGLEPETR